MGLDQYAFAVKEEDVISDFEFKNIDDYDDIAYWRKFGSLNNYMTNLYYMKGGVSLDDGSFLVRLTLEDLQKLKYTTMQNNLPHGYNLMDKKDCIISILNFVKEAKCAIANDYEIYYGADW